MLRCSLESRGMVRMSRCSVPIRVWAKNRTWHVAISAEGSGTSIRRCRKLYSTRLHHSQDNYHTANTISADHMEEASPELEELLPSDFLSNRHIGIRPHKLGPMLNTLGKKSLNDLVASVIPPQILSYRKLKIHNAPVSESEMLERLAAIAQKNIKMKSYIGMGYYNTIVPPVISRNVLENPGWYTSYTPYQPEISQGRLECLLTFQTLVSELTGLPIANSSLLDEGTAAAEAMAMCFNVQKKLRKTFLVDRLVHPQTIACVQSRATGFDITVKVVDALDYSVYETAREDIIGVLVQYPATNGSINDYSALANQLHSFKGQLIVATDLLALTLLTPPGEWGADIAVGSAQRFGVPLGYGGPHAAFLACTKEYQRKMPGRLVGVSIDRLSQRAYRLALQTREQHIRREKATSNICTAQALLANMSALYAAYHGPSGLKSIASRVSKLTALLNHGLRQQGHKVVNDNYFDTLTIEPKQAVDLVLQKGLRKGINLRRYNAECLSVSIDETTSQSDIAILLSVFNPVYAAEASREHDKTMHEAIEQIELKKMIEAIVPNQLRDPLSSKIETKFRRSSSYLHQPVFNSYHSETEMLRYIFYLQSRDLSLAHSMIPLGSCTMKLNATTEMIPISWPGFKDLHPFAPINQAAGYMELISDLEKDLANITGLDAVSLQPNSGAQGEYAGLRVIRAFHTANDQRHRDICLIPVSAHGTNPASATLAGMKVVGINCDSTGNLDIFDLRIKVQKHAENLAAIMITYPSTFGVFEEQIKEAIDLIHEHGGQVYLDGANMTAQIGLCSPGGIGADVCHLNLHKTFCIPHGGGGPGVGPIAVKKHLAPFLPGHPVVSTGGDQCIKPISAAPWGSASILAISYSYIKMMGGKGLTDATKIALLNANYMRARLSSHYKILYSNAAGMCAHEFIIDAREFKQSAGIEVIDIAKRLQDFGFHSPTMSWPVSGTLMIEPTESESVEELDRFCECMICIRKEIQEIEDGTSPRDNNLLVNAPHPMIDIVRSDWDRPYTREQAAYPLPYLKQKKFWPTVARLNDAYGDQNLFCTCEPVLND